MDTALPKRDCEVVVVANLASKGPQGRNFQPESCLRGNAICVAMPNRAICGSTEGSPRTLRRSIIISEVFGGMPELRMAAIRARGGGVGT